MTDLHMFADAALWKARCASLEAQLEAAKRSELESDRRAREAEDLLRGYANEWHDRVIAYLDGLDKQSVVVKP